MERFVTLKVELEISAQKIANYVQLHNETVEQQVAKGLEKAIEELTNEDNFVNLVCESAKKEISDITRKIIMSWEIKDKLNKLIQERIGLQLEEYADRIAASMIEQIKK